MIENTTEDIYYLGQKAEYLFQFEDFWHWVNKATILFRAYKPKGAKTICLDKNNHDCKIGIDFMYARDNDLFPIKVYALNKNN